MEHNQSEQYLTKQIAKLFHRIERILVPSNEMKVSTIGPKLANLLNQVRNGDYFKISDSHYGRSTLSSKRLIEKAYSKDQIGFIPKKLQWDIFKPVLDKILLEEVSNSIPLNIIEEIEIERKAQEEVESKFKIKSKVEELQNRNGQPVIQGPWRKKPYPSRSYVPLTDYIITDSISSDEAIVLKQQLHTSLHGFLGPAYNYDDHSLTEEWMLSFKDRTTATQASDDDVIRTQLTSLLEIMMGQIQDRVCNENGILNVPPIGLGSKLKEAPVWGLDCYTRTMIELSIQDNINKKSLATKSNIVKYIEKRLLPTINKQSVENAHNITYTLNELIQDPKSSEYDILYSQAILQHVQELGIDLFRIHPKGTGVICTDPAGIPAHVVITEYLGEIYPPYRWCERIDVVEKARTNFELKPTLPDFYNILLERPRQDPNGYGLLFVDASQKANMGSSCSHSCDSNCTSAVVARNGKLVIVLTTVREVQYGEELTMDYNSITTSDVEWRAAVCLCGMSSCRGSFLSFSTQEDLQQVLNQNCGPLWRYASLLRSRSRRPLSNEDKNTLTRHGMLSVALGSNPPVWIQRYVADNLRFIEFERKALPCALMRRKTDDKQTIYSFSSADGDARIVMEQRLQSLVCCISMVDRVLTNQPSQTTTECNDQKRRTSHSSPMKSPSKVSKVSPIRHDHILNTDDTTTCSSIVHPIEIVSSIQAASIIFTYLQEIPELIERYMLLPLLCQITNYTTIKKATYQIVNKKSIGASSSKSNLKLEDKILTTASTTSMQGMSCESENTQWKKTIEKVMPLYIKVKNTPVVATDSSNQEKVVKKPLNDKSFSSLSSSVVLSTSTILAPVAAPISLTATTNNIETISTIDHIIKICNDIKSVLQTASDSTSSHEIHVTSPNSAPIKGLFWIRDICNKIINLLSDLEDYATSTARISLLKDILILWANTTNFSSIQYFQPVMSKELSVPARELGTSIPRSRLFKAEPTTTSKRRRESSTSNGVINPASTTSTTTSTTTSVAYTATSADDVGDDDKILLSKVRKLDDATTTATVTLSIVNGVNMSTDQYSIAGETNRESSTSTPVNFDDDATYWKTEPTSSNHFTSIQVSQSATIGIINSPTPRSNGFNSYKQQEVIDGDMTDSPSSEDPSFSISSTHSIASVPSPTINISMNECKEDINLFTASSTSTVIENVDMMTVTNTNVNTSTAVYNAMEVSTSATTSYATNATNATTTSNTNHSSTGNNSNSNNSSKLSSILDPNEVVFTGVKTYEEDFVFKQMMDWYKAGSGEPELPLDLFGTVQLPIPNMCFGKSKNEYKPDIRQQLVTILQNEKLHVIPWPKTLRDCFYMDENNILVQQWNKRILMGSPLLDVMLGQVDAIYHVLKAFNVNRRRINMSTKSNDNNNTDHQEHQLDDILPPEVPTAWVQCDLCHKWRRVAWHVDSEKLPESWECSMNFWDPENATCTAIQDYYDPETENTVQTSANDTNDNHIKFIYSIKIGSWMDVYCTKNKVYYEAQVLKIASPGTRSISKGIKNAVKQFLFHFKGWSSKYDEWIDSTSERITIHNLYTNPMSTKPREQEKWQGLTLNPDAILSSSKKGKKKGTNTTSSNTSVSSTIITTTEVNMKSRKTKKSTTTMRRKSTGSSTISQTTTTKKKIGNTVNDSERRMTTSDVTLNFLQQDHISDDEDDIHYVTSDQRVNIKPYTCNYENTGMLSTEEQIEDTMLFDNLLED